MSLTKREKLRIMANQFRIGWSYESSLLSLFALLLRYKYRWLRNTRRLALMRILSFSLLWTSYWNLTNRNCVLYRKIFIACNVGFSNSYEAEVRWRRSLKYYQRFIGTTVGFSVSTSDVRFSHVLIYGYDSSTRYCYDRFFELYRV